MQLNRAIFLAWAVLAALGAPARAEDKFDFTTTWFQEKREENKGLTVINPQLSLGFDAGEHVTIGAGYAADIVSGATAAVYSVDVVSSATEFSDTRHEGTLSLGFTGHRSTLSISGTAGVERDYASIAVSVGGSVDLPGKNTNLALGYAHNFDEVCDRDNATATPLSRRALTGVDTCEKNVLFGVDRPGETVWRDITIDTTQATLTQNLAPTVVLQLSIFGSVIDGFQSNPYRRVRVSGREAQEAEPLVRGRLAVTARLNKHFPGLRGTLGVSGRGYSDTWGIQSGTLEMDYSQYAGKSLLLRLRTRIYQQTAATFFKDAFFYETEGPANAYFTGDRELAPLRHALVGAKLSYLKVAADGNQVWGFLDEVDLNIKADLLLFQELAADSEVNNPGGIEGQYLTSGLFDGFVLQLGVLMRY